jgi:hypothetical protein
LDQQTLQPESAFWMDANGSPMAILKYKDLQEQENPRETVLAFLESAYQGAATLANWNVEDLRVPPLESL